MKSVITSLLTAITTLHAGLGCYVFHGHSLDGAITEPHDCSAHHEGADHEGIPPWHGGPHDCDDQPCSFLSAKCRALVTLELLSALAQHSSLFSTVEIRSGWLESIPAWETTHDPSGPALHIWHGILVV